MTDSLDAIAAGHLCLDIIPDLSASEPEQFRRAFVPGRLVQVGDADFCTGGAVSNVGLGLHKLGIRTQLMGKVGDDTFGRVIRQFVEAHGPGLAGGMVVDSAASTSYTLVINPPGIDRFFLHFPGANDTFGAADVRYDLLRGARLFHFGYPPIMRLMYEDGGAQLVEVLRRAKATGVTTSLDTSLPDPASPAGRADWVAILEAALPHTDIFLPSVEEILFMLRRSLFDRLKGQAGGGDILSLITPQLLSDLGQAMLDMGVTIAGLKLGERGLYLCTGGRAAVAGLGRAAPAAPAAWADRELWSPCFRVDAVGTAGAGDATIAGFLAALLRGLGPEAAVNAAVAVGACNVEAADTLSGIRSWEETMARMAGGWAKRRLSLEAAGWLHDEPWGLWVGPAG